MHLPQRPHDFKGHQQNVTYIELETHSVFSINSDKIMKLQHMSSLFFLYFNTQHPPNNSNSLKLFKKEYQFFMDSSPYRRKIISKNP